MSTVAPQSYPACSTRKRREQVDYPLLVDFRSGLVFSTGAGVFAAAVYASYWTGTFPLYSQFEGGFPMAASWIGLFAWAVLVVYLARGARSGAEAGVPSSTVSPG